MGETGGNYLCPCGSGKIFKQCCLVKAAPAGMENLTKALLNEIKEEVEKRHFSSTDEINIFIRDFMQGVNQEAKEDFLGFSPDQMHRILNFTLEGTEDIVKFNNSLKPAIYQQIPIVADSLIFLQVLREKEPRYDKQETSCNMVNDGHNRLYFKRSHSGFTFYQLDTA